MDMLRSEKISEAALADWRKPAQGLPARYLVDNVGVVCADVSAAAKG